MRERRSCVVVAVGLGSTRACRPIVVGHERINGVIAIVGGRRAWCPAMAVSSIHEDDLGTAQRSNPNRELFGERRGPTS